MRNLEGICPECKEWTVAGESCCGSGAIVEGGLITDEYAEEILEDEFQAKLLDAKAYLQLTAMKLEANLIMKMIFNLSTQSQIDEAGKLIKELLAEIEKINKGEKK